jgi:small subunit ribosomal protein S20
MAIILSAKRAIRVSKRRKVHNDRRVKTMRNEVKEMKKLIVAKDVKTAAQKMKDAYKAIDKAAKRGVIKKNTASRKKSKLRSIKNPL